MYYIKESVVNYWAYGDDSVYGKVIKMLKGLYNIDIEGKREI